MLLFLKHHLKLKSNSTAPLATWPPLATWDTHNQQLPRFVRQGYKYWHRVWLITTTQHMFSQWPTEDSSAATDDLSPFSPSSFRGVPPQGADACNMKLLVLGLFLKLQRPFHFTCYLDLYFLQNGNVLRAPEHHLKLWRSVFPLGGYL